MTDRELMQQTLDALEYRGNWINPPIHVREAIKALRTRLAQPEPKKEWVGLTDDEKLIAYSMYEQMGSIGFVQAIEAKLKEKNT